MRTPANKQTDKQKISATQRFEISTLAVLAQFSYRLSYRVVIIRLLLSDYYCSPNSPNFMKIRPVVHVKQLSGSQIRFSIRITPNLEHGLPMIITSLLTKFHENPTSSSCETVIRILDPDFNQDHAQPWTRSSYDHYLPTHEVSSKLDQ